MNKDISTAIVIGRFQTFHAGHQTLIDRAMQLADRIIIVIGSSTFHDSLRNPFTFHERMEMIIKTYRGDPKNKEFIFIDMPDSAYNFNEWVFRLRTRISQYITKNMFLVGHYKDETSYYLDFFPEWKLETVKNFYDLSSTQIRNILFGYSQPFLKPALKEYMDKGFISEFVYSFLIEYITTSRYSSLHDEYLFIEKYKDRWNSAPYPPTFITTDAVVFCMNHVLLIERKINPGKGKYALPGGFVNQNEKILNACLRELKEETCLPLHSVYLKNRIFESNLFDEPKRDPRGRTITKAFAFDLDLKQLPDIKGSDDAARAFWYSLNYIEEFEYLFFLDHSQIIRFFMNRLK